MYEIHKPGLFLHASLSRACSNAACVECTLPACASYRMANTRLLTQSCGLVRTTLSRMERTLSSMLRRASLHAKRSKKIVFRGNRLIYFASCSRRKPGLKGLYKASVYILTLMHGRLSLTLAWHDSKASEQHTEATAHEPGYLQDYERLIRQNR